jgi:NAD(P)-dependent dehydrogenase (short-subunit alcohol dehydrogenase family)
MGDVGSVPQEMLSDLTGRKALNIGGDFGIGAAVAIAFAREGATVAFSDLPTEKTTPTGSSKW